MVAATLALGRSRFVERLAIVADGVDDLRAKLAEFAAGTGDAADLSPGMVRGRAASGTSPEIANILNVSSNYQMIIKGAIIAIAVLVDIRGKSRNE